MGITLEIVTPGGTIYSDTVENVVIPTDMGEVGILPGHIPLMCTVKPSELTIYQNAESQFFAVDKGFAKVIGDTVSVLTESAINIQDIDLSLVAEAQARAEEALKHARNNPDADPADIEHFESVMRFAITQQLVKGRH